MLQVFSATSLFMFLFLPPGLSLRTEPEHMIAAVIATPPMVESVNKIVCYPEPLTPVPPGPPNAKRSKFPSGPAVLLVTDLAPLLTFDPVKCSVLLCFPTKEAGSASRHCQLINLDLQGALEGKFQPRLFEDCSIDSGNACYSVIICDVGIINC